MPSWFQGSFKFVVLPKEAVLPSCYFNFPVLAQVFVGCVMNHIKKRKVVLKVVEGQASPFNYLGWKVRKKREKALVWTRALGFQAQAMFLADVVLSKCWVIVTTPFHIVDAHIWQSVGLF